MLEISDSSSDSGSESSSSVSSKDSLVGADSRDSSSGDSSSSQSASITPGLGNEFHGATNLGTRINPLTASDSGSDSSNESGSDSSSNTRSDSTQASVNPAGTVPPSASKLKRHKPIICIGHKGRLTTKHKNPREKKDKEYYFTLFARLCYGGNEVQARQGIQDFKALNLARRIQEANVYLIDWNHRGAKRTLLNKMFSIGSTRYQTILNRGYKKPKSGDNKFKITKEMVEQLEICRQCVPIDDEGMACNHRQYIFYIGDPEITSVKKLWGKYYKDNDAIDGRKMSAMSFHKYWGKYHSDIRFRKLKEDECDTCIQLQIG